MKIISAQQEGWLNYSMAIQLSLINTNHDITVFIYKTGKEFICKIMYIV